MRATITSAEVFGFVALLGVEPKDVREVTIDRDKVTVTEFRRDESGGLLIAGEFAAEVVTEIPIDRSEQ
ncbi:hypothetical protein [Actinomadura litoris]|uniref:hypothetical protein n=1 Tax=Actinomadura litoris TaxID=2678616 RepID=UPI001FA72738|nr:hypothetical protein [Actinomadura litoris]